MLSKFLYVSFLPPFFLCFSGFLGFLVFSFPSGFSGLAITWLTHYCWSCDRNSVHWLMFDIILHLVTDQVSGDVRGGGQYDACWCWTYLNMYITVTVIEITPQYFAWSYFFVSLGFGFLFLMLPDWLLLWIQIWINHNLVMRSSLTPFQVGLNCTFWEIFITYADIYFPWL